MAKTTHIGCTHCGCEDSNTVFERVPYGMGYASCPSGGVCTDCGREWEEGEWCNECEQKIGSCECHRCSDCRELVEECHCRIELTGSVTAFVVYATWLRETLTIDNEDAFDNQVAGMATERADEIYVLAVDANEVLISKNIVPVGRKSVDKTDQATTRIA